MSTGNKLINLDGLKVVYNQIQSNVNDVVSVQNSQPVSESNKIWISSAAEQEIEVPTYEEFNELRSALDALEARVDALHGGISATARTLLITILSAGVYTSDQSDNIAALEAALDDDSDVTITQSGTTLIFGNVPAITSITQSGTALVCA